MHMTASICCTERITNLRFTNVFRQLRADAFACALLYWLTASLFVCLWVCWLVRGLVGWLIRWLTDVKLAFRYLIAFIFVAINFMYIYMHTRVLFAAAVASFDHRRYLDSTTD